MTIAKGNQNIVVGSNKSVTDSIAELEIDFNRHASNKSIHTPALTTNLTIYVDVNTGSDETGDGSENNPYKTFRYAQNIAPRDFGGNILNYMVSEGTYEIDNIARHMNGIINITRFGAVKPTFKLTKQTEFTNCNKINLTNIKIDGNQNNLVFGNINVNFNYCDIENCNKINAGDGSRVHQYGGSLKNNNQIWLSGSSSVVSLDGVANGGGNIVGLTADAGFIITDTIFELPSIEVNGGRVFSSQNANESGTWNIKIGGETTFGNHTYTLKQARYTKTQNLVHCQFHIVGTIDSANTGVLIISGLPFLPKNYYEIGVANGNNQATAIINSGSKDKLRLFNTSGAIQCSQLTNGNFFILGSIEYEI